MLMLYAVKVDEILPCRDPMTLSKGAMIGLSTCKIERGSQCEKREEVSKWAIFSGVKPMKFYLIKSTSILPL